MFLNIKVHITKINTKISKSDELKKYLLQRVGLHVMKYYIIRFIIVPIYVRKHIESWFIVKTFGTKK